MSYIRFTITNISVWNNGGLYRFDETVTITVTIQSDLFRVSQNYTEKHLRVLVVFVTSYINLVLIPWEFIYKN